jgi:hypothetical protein
MAATKIILALNAISHALNKDCLDCNSVYLFQNHHLLHAASTKQTGSSIRSNFHFSSYQSSSLHLLDGLMPVFSFHLKAAREHPQIII